MEYKKINLVYFSATNTTRQVLASVARGIGIDAVVHYNITLGLLEDLYFKDDEVVVFGMPVYAGRIPKIAASYLERIIGKGTPAIVVCVYGNRDYEDALLELKDVVTGNGFRVVSAAAFIGQHAIFPRMGSCRPDESDHRMAASFGYDSYQNLLRIPHAAQKSEIKLKGNFPYRDVKPIALFPSGSERCNLCGKCAANCPAQAIDDHNPQVTNQALCISCGRCVAICPQGARQFCGTLFQETAQRFYANFTERKTCEVFHASSI